MHEKGFLGGGVGVGESPKQGAWIVSRFKRGLGKKKERGYVFKVRGLRPHAHYELEDPSY